MATVVKIVNLVKSDPINNNNKFWRGTLYDNDDVLCEWGRVGDSGQSKMFPGKGLRFLESKVNDKKRDGRNGEIAYKEIEVIAAADVPKSVSPVTVAKTELKTIATSQIRHTNPTVKKLIEYFTDVNAHNIHNATGGKISYNYDTGLFQTPLGLVTQAAIDDARRLLVQIGDHVDAGTYTTALQRLTGEYMMLVPQDIGHKRLDVRDFWSDLSKVQSQNGILDSLQASLVTATTAPKKADAKTDAPVAPSIFNVEVNLIEDGKEIDRVRKLYAKTRQSIHASYKLEVQKLYSVAINTVNEAFDRDGAKMSNIWELWHGTKASNVLSILKGGLIIPPSSSPHVCGRLYGDGLYFSDQSTKSLNYATNYWTGGGATNKTFMFLCSVAMGNQFKPHKSNYTRISYPQKGYDSTFAEAGQGTMNNEMIVYRCSQAKLNLLVEFG